MRIMILLLLVGVGVSYANNTYSQSTKLTLNLQSKTIKEVFSEIEKKSEYIFLYNEANVDRTKKVSVHINGQTIDKILDEVFKNTDNTYQISGRQVFVSKAGNAAPAKKEQTTQVPSQQITITGIVTDTDGEPLIGVSIRPKSTTTTGVGVTTDFDGKFSIEVGSMKETLLFTYIGMKSHTLVLKAGTTNYKVVMESNTQELGEVVIQAGIMQRDKISFTGSVKQMSREELRSVGNINVLQSLRSLDPSFVMAENVMGGSDPNQLANISLRGGSTMNLTSTFDDMSVNPNEPLFILDGFPTTLQTINDLNINRIESITILKDASATAIYGSQGGNGVIVVETVKPKVGQLRVGYDGNMQLSVADLSVYNMMNAAEKLDFEVKSGRYLQQIDNEWRNVDYWRNTNIPDYLSRLENVKAGVDTYWLKVPIRTGLTQDHSIYVDGGNESGVLYQIGAQFRNVEGVMKGSSRQTFGGNMKLQYRKNNINVQNNLTVTITNAHNGSWGAFSAFANANPYYRMINEDGTISPQLDNFEDVGGQRTTIAPNPYYNATLNSKDDTGDLSIVNNTSFEWRILENLRWAGGLQLQTMRSESETFKDPRHTDFTGMDYTLQGSYQARNSNLWSYDANTTIAYSESIKEAHNLTFTGRASAVSEQFKGDGYLVTGFPKGVPGIPSYSYDYLEGSRPAYTEPAVRRMVSFLLALNYNYKFRYLFDFNLQSDGTTAFGQSKKFQTFWSAGIGWNINREAFAEDWTWADYLKVRGSFGKNGNQNVDNISTNIYNYFSGNDVFGPGAYLDQIGNSHLRWQVVNKASAGLDVTALDNRLNLTFDVYHTKTDPLVVPIIERPSTGVNQFSRNLGYLTGKGMELSASYQIIKDIPRGIMLSARFSGRINKQEYGGFANALENLNNSYKEEKTEEDVAIDPNMNINSLVHYQDGSSPSDLWAVRSLGIDPATGKELFLDKYGTPTDEYDPDDRVIIASKTPDVDGTFGFTFRIKDFTANFNFGYSFGGYAFNNALYDKVENISTSSIIFNQDRRALYDRWQTAGDIAQFKNIRVIGLRGGTSTNTPISSRFIQRNNYLSGESARLSWEFAKSKWVQSLGMEYLTLSLSYNDLFYLSTMKRERGIDYPFARSVTLGLSAQF